MLSLLNSGRSNGHSCIKKNDPFLKTVNISVTFFLTIEHSCGESDMSNFPIIPISNLKEYKPNIKCFENLISDKEICSFKLLKKLLFKIEKTEILAGKKIKNNLDKDK